jgi:hypothetical protein
MTRDFRGLFATIMCRKPLACAGAGGADEKQHAKSIRPGNPWMGPTLCSRPSIAPHRLLNQNLGLNCEHFDLVARPQVKLHVAAIAPVLSLREAS